MQARVGRPTLRALRIELQHVRRTFGERHAIADLDLDIGSGQLCVLLGPSGCGKSTTLRCIAGLESVDGGEIRFDGRVVNDLDPAQRDVAMVFQNYALYPHMSVAENIAFPLRMRRVAREERERRVSEVALVLGLDELLQRRPKQLSGGQQQRVALARALVREPRVFLFDEPLSNLDARLRLDLRQEIKALHARLGATMLWVTHDQAEAMTLGDSIAVLDRGRLQQVGSPLEVFRRPRNRFVAGFVGSPPMSFVPATVRSGKLRVFGHELCIGAVDGDFEVGIRPHDLRLTDLGPSTLEAVVVAVESHGHESFVVLEHGGARVTAWARGHAECAVGGTVRAGFSVQDLHVFARDGARVEPLAP